LTTSVLLHKYNFFYIRGHYGKDAEVRASRAQVVSEVLGRKVTRGQLSEAFDRVSDRLNWKKPIDRVVSIADASTLGP
jgi:hypothetical protein